MCQGYPGRGTLDWAPKYTEQSNTISYFWFLVFQTEPVVSAPTMSENYVRSSPATVGGALRQSIKLHKRRLLYGITSFLTSIVCEGFFVCLFVNLFISLVFSILENFP